MLLQDVQKLIQPLRNRVMLMVARGVIKLVNDKGGLQTLQLGLLEDELRDQVERVQDYGFTSNPLPGAEAVTVFIGGNRDHGLTLKVDDRRYRLKGLKGGEVALYTDEGDFIHLKRGNNIEVKTKHLLADAQESCAVNTKVYTVNCISYTVNASGAVSLAAGGAMGLTSAALGIVTGALTAGTQDGGDMEATVKGNITTSKDVKADSGRVSLTNHKHAGVTAGGEQTSTPV